jgi:hypothetical protein
MSNLMTTAKMRRQFTVTRSQTAQIYDSFDTGIASRQREILRAASFFIFK